ncbi:ZIP family metal transporter [Lactonifactor sp. BIOML-A3]|uniref:ZIP family metal transporter n=1 Tax=unclassified Lactonifactor TaxID=2636670 RepID=UPI0012AEE1BC|nr:MULTISPECIES: ZIP family metal transporter [unclassified Lactonifactor]MSA02752.1 ZIP family metal transporter [Lactonifactor sp. BIOML-A5]MSA09291.1 ZIP family metal transporter [Lactonifactor sp. BIOML-A4]MSA13818.1 ZIP family metal transporter [Lactonifactor sp. BIOML-A3]MSA18346.1 ZIP family metal transporter [Lactonifactor sp. BIOML-A2]MSA39252.1 ZIP family metal transporter [Lactonifactor sp. BIOML-A1]
MSALESVILITAAAGVGGTGMGGIIGGLFKKDSTKTVSLLLSFAGGVMLSIVCFDLLISAINTKTNIVIIIAGVLMGIALVFLLNYIIDKRTNSEVPHIDAAHPHTADDLNELIHSDHLEAHRRNKDSRASLFIAGAVMACAIALHNVPEGMTIGASFANSKSLFTGSALVLAVLIGLHNIPEGMAVAVPLISGGMSRGRAIVVTALSGAPTIIGALLGFWLGDIGPLGLALSLCFASGAMLYVVFGEILPQAILMYRSKSPAFSVIVGMMVGILIIYL